MNDRSLDSQSLAMSMDMLAESLNIGLGQVINQLSDIFGSQVELHVPSIKLAAEDDLKELADELFGTDSLLVIEQGFEGDLTGQAMLFFPDNEEQHLLGKFFSGDQQSNIAKASLSQLNIVQMANVAVTGVINALSTMLQVDIKTQKPVCRYIPVRKIIQSLREDEENLLFLTISFNSISSNTHAQLLLCKSPDTLSKIHQAICKQMRL